MPEVRERIKDLRSKQAAAASSLAPLDWTALSNMRGGGSIPGIPMPMADPRKSFSEMPPVQSLEGGNVQATLNGSAEVTGEVTVKNEITAGSALIAIARAAENATVQLRGMLNSSGPGSLGHSSPDAAAPAPSTGVQPPISY